MTVLGPKELQKRAEEFYSVYKSADVLFGGRQKIDQEQDDYRKLMREEFIKLASKAWEKAFEDAVLELMNKLDADHAMPAASNENAPYIIREADAGWSPQEAAHIRLNAAYQAAVAKVSTDMREHGLMPDDGWAISECISYRQDEAVYVVRLVPSNANRWRDDLSCSIWAHL